MQSITTEYIFFPNHVEHLPKLTVCSTRKHDSTHFKVLISLRKIVFILKREILKTRKISKYLKIKKHTSKKSLGPEEISREVLKHF